MWCKSCQKSWPADNIGRFHKGCGGEQTAIDPNATSKPNFVRTGVSSPKVTPPQEIGSPVSIVFAASLGSPSKSEGAQGGTTVKSPTGTTGSKPGASTPEKTTPKKTPWIEAKEQAMKLGRKLVAAGVLDADDFNKDYGACVEAYNKANMDGLIQLERFVKRLAGMSASSGAETLPPRGKTPITATFETKPVDEPTTPKSVGKPSSTVTGEESAAEIENLKKRVAALLKELNAGPESVTSATALADAADLGTLKNLVVKLEAKLKEKSEKAALTEQDRIQKEKEVGGKAEQERLQKIEADRVQKEKEAAEKAEKERVQKIEAERIQKEKEAARLKAEEEEAAAKKKVEEEERELAEIKKLKAEAAKLLEVVKATLATGKVAKYEQAIAKIEGSGVEFANKVVQLLKGDEAAAKMKAEEEAAAKKKAEEEAKAEKERLAKIEADRVQKEKEAAEKAEKERLQKVEADRLQKEKEAAEKAEKERLAKEAQAEKERLAKEQEEKLKQEAAVESSPVTGGPGKVRTSKMSTKEAEALKALSSKNPKLAASVKRVLEELGGPGAEALPRLTPSEAEATIKDSEKNVKEAIDKQFNHVREAVLNLWHALGRLGLALPEFTADVFNGTRGAAVDKWNTHAPGAHEAAIQDLQKFWDEMKKKSAQAAKEAEEMDASKGLTAEKENQTNAEAAKADAKKALAATHLLDALQFGMLSRPPAPETDLVLAAAREKATDDIIKKFKDHPDTALDALHLVGRAKNPAVVVKGISVVGKLRAGGFADAKGASYSVETAGDMTRNALQMGDMVGGNFFEDMEAFYGTDKHSKDDPLVPTKIGEDGKAKPIPDAGGKQKGIAYTKKIANDLIGRDGKVNFANAKATVDNLKFHPGSLITPLFALTANLEDVKEKFTKPGTNNLYVKKLGEVKAPKNGGHGEKAKGLVRDCLGLDHDATPTAADSQRAVMSALITPFAQGQVGSCFATGPCLKFKEATPLDYIADLGQIVENGTLKKGTGTALPVITNLPKANKENPLMRSWEYSVTTLGARTENSHQKQKLASSLFKDPTSSFGALGGAEQTKVKTAVGKAFTFAYDPVTKLPGIGADGSSSKGKWGLKHVTAGREDAVDTEEKFLASLKSAVEKELAIDVIADVPTGLSKTATEEKEAEKKEKEDLKAKIDELFTGSGKATFVAKMRESFDDGRGAPWAMSGGGTGEGPTEVLFPGGPMPVEEKFFNPATVTGNKAGALLTSLVGAVPENAPKHVAVSVAGIHGMNLLPGHPSLARLRPSSGKTANDKLREELLEPGAKIAASQPKERMVALHQKAISSVIGSLFGEDKDGLAGVTPPSGDQTPEAFKASLLSQVETRIAANVDMEMEKDPAPVTKAVQKKFQAVQAKHNEECAKIRKSDEEARAAVRKSDGEAREAVREKDRETQDKLREDHDKERKKIRAKYDTDFAAYEKDFDQVEPDYRAAHANYEKEWDKWTAEGQKGTQPVAPTRRPQPTAPPSPVYPPAPTMPPDSPLPEDSPLPPDSPQPPPPVLEDHEDRLKTEYKESRIKQKTDGVKKGIDNVLMKELAPPEFVIADTNWGGPTGHTMHVIAPDPCTGLPILWKKDEPGGTFERESDDWLTKEWGVLKKGPSFT